MALMEKDFGGGEMWVKADTAEEFLRWIQEEPGWPSIEQFEKEIGVSFELEMKGRWFIIIEDRVYTRHPENAPPGEEREYVKEE